MPGYPMENIGKETKVEELENSKVEKQEFEEDWEAEADPNPKLRGYRGPSKADFARQRKERKERLKTVHLRYNVFMQETQQTTGSK